MTTLEEKGDALKKLLPCKIIEPVAPAKAAVIWLHGLGASSDDFLDIVPEFRLPADSGIRFIFPDAPVRPVTLNNGHRMQAWYDITGLDLQSREDHQGIRESEQAVNALIAHEQSLGIDSQKIILAGFSQGGAMALHCGLRYPDQLAGVLALSTYLPLFDTVAGQMSTANKKTPILMLHGSSDAIVPESWALLSLERLRSLNYSVEWQTYPMGHSVCLKEVQDIANWLKRVLLD